MAAWMRSATSCRLLVRSSSSSASSFFSPSAEIGTGLSGLMDASEVRRGREKKNTEGRLGPQRSAAYGGSVAKSYTVSARLLAHYRRTEQDLQWRRTHDPYDVLVSEEMLQQTHASRATPAFDLLISPMSPLQH